MKLTDDQIKKMEPVKDIHVLIPGDLGVGINSIHVTISDVFFDFSDGKELEYWRTTLQKTFAELYNDGWCRVMFDYEVEEQEAEKEGYNREAH